MTRFLSHSSVWPLAMVILASCAKPKDPQAQNELVKNTLLEEITVSVSGVEQNEVIAGRPMLLRGEFRIPQDRPSALGKVIVQIDDQKPDGSTVMMTSSVLDLKETESGRYAIESRFNAPARPGHFEVVLVHHGAEFKAGRVKVDKP